MVSIASKKSKRRGFQHSDFFILNLEHGTESPRWSNRIQSTDSVRKS